MVIMCGVAVRFRRRDITIIGHRRVIARRAQHDPALWFWKGLERMVNVTVDAAARPGPRRLRAVPSRVPAAPCTANASGPDPGECTDPNFPICNVGGQGSWCTKICTGVDDCTTDPDDAGCKPTGCNKKGNCK